MSINSAIAKIRAKAGMVDGFCLDVVAAAWEQAKAASPREDFEASLKHDPHSAPPRPSSWCIRCLSPINGGGFTTGVAAGLAYWCCASCEAKWRSKDPEFWAAVDAYR